MPDWIIDRILSFCDTNNIKLIIGYWIQEEDFQDEDPVAPSYQLECDLDDLEVAKKTIGRIVQKYSNDPSVLFWGIGNEVTGSFNQGWFKWTVNPIDYLNSLYSYIRSIDPNRKPIMYAKFIGESVGFSTLSADIIGPQAYIFSANQLKGEFSAPPPYNRAYLLAEFAHRIEHIDGHWELATKHAGGCFIEYVDVWWKSVWGEDQDKMGIVEEYRKIKDDRYSPLSNIYLKTVVSSTIY